MRYLSLTNDPNSAAGGSSLDDLVAGAIPPAPAADLVVVTTGQVDPGVRNLTREDDVRNRRAESEPISFSAAPSLSFSSRAWTTLMRRLLPKGMGGGVASTGANPAAIESTVQTAPLDAILPAFNGTLVRAGQTDRVSGLWVNELTFDAPAEGEATIEGNLMGLFHDVDETGSVAGLANPTGADSDDQNVAYMLRDVTAILGDGAGVQVDCLTGFGFTLNNNLSDDFQTRYCAGRNVLVVDVDGQIHRVWYPDRNKARAQTVTGRLDFSDVRPDRELRRIVTHAEKLVVELVAEPLGTVPVVDEAIRLVFHKQASTGGGAGPLTRTDDQRSSYEFTAYLATATGKDFEATFVGETAIPVNLHTY